MHGLARVSLKPMHGNRHVVVTAGQRRESEHAGSIAFSAGVDTRPYVVHGYESARNDCSGLILNLPAQACRAHLGARSGRSDQANLQRQKDHDGEPDPANLPEACDAL